MAKLIYVAWTACVWSYFIVEKIYSKAIENTVDL
jgi:hypothetical protein